MSDDLDFDMEVVGMEQLDSKKSGGEETRERGSRSTEMESEEESAEASRDRSLQPDYSSVDSPENWGVHKLRDVLSYEVSGTWGDDPDNGNGKPVLRATNFAPDSIDLSDVALRKISDSHRKSKRLESGDIVLERSGGSADQPVGRVLFFDLEGEYYPGNFLRLLRPNSGVINGRYLYYSLDYRYRRGDTVAVQTNSTNIRNLQYSSYLNLDVEVPPLPEQRKIASVLYTVDQAIQKTEAIIEQAKRVRRGVEQNLLTRGVLDDGSHRAGNKTENKSSWVGEVPEEWEVYEYGELLQDSSVGIVVKPSQYYDDSGTVPILRSKDISRDGVENGEFEYMTEGSNEENSNSKLSEGDVITVRSGDPGLSCVVSSEHDGANCADLLISTPGTNLVPGYAAMWINSYAGRRQIDRFQAGLAQKHFNLGALRKLRIALPTVDEQKRIVETESRIAARIAKERQVWNRLMDLKKGLMQDLLTGGVRTADKAIEVLDEVEVHG
jgi:type I restriction enzyme S subunit